MSGGFKEYGSTAKSPERLEGMTKVIREIDADFVSLVDTHRWTEVFREDDLRRLFGYKNVYMVNLEDERLKVKGHDNGVTVMTRLPVEKFETIRIFNRNAIRTSVEGVDIFTTYLDDLSEDTRLKQVGALFEKVEAKRPVIITGDLNSFDQDDLMGAKTGLKILYSFNANARSMEPVTNEMARAEVTKLIKENGFRDMGKGKGNTIPSKLFPIKLNGPMLRVDYGFCTPNIKVESFEVLRGEEFDKLSDHFPIMMSVKIGD